VTAGRYDLILHELTGTTDSFIAVLDGVSPAQWTFQPAPETWSVGQIAEHTTAVLRSSQRFLTTKLLQQRLPPDPPGPRVTDEQIVNRMFDRTRRFSAPETVQPKGRWATREELLHAFVESRNTLAQWCAPLTINLREFGTPHPMFGLLDGIQWMVFIAAHTERHTHQILELKRVQGFPT
jgi:hypothetical protein